MQQISDKLNHYKLAQGYIIEGFPRDKDQLEEFYKQVKLALQTFKMCFGQQLHIIYYLL